MTRAPLAILGTSSHAGKTTVVAGLCRLYARRGLRVAPLKSQNMSLNSYATRHGEEIARSTAVQARAAQQEPTVAMNPILLKPKADDVSQLILFGKPYADVSAAEYFGSDKLQALKWQAIDAAIASLRRDYDLIIVEGAGSCAEPNLRALDVVNFGLARRLAAEVHILCDIDKGGVFADILGTLQVLSLTEPADAALVRGFLINKFRGDLKILDGGLDFIRPHLGSASLGVLPYLDLSLEEEDRIRPRRCLHPEIDIAVLYLPHIANATDFEHLSVEENVSLRFVRRADELLSPDAIIVPGSKNTIWDLEYLRRCLIPIGRSQVPDRCRDWGCSRSILPFSATSWCGRVVIGQVSTTRFPTLARSKGTRFTPGDRSIGGRCRCSRVTRGPTERSMPSGSFLARSCMTCGKTRALRGRSSTGCGCAKV